MTVWYLSYGGYGTATYASVGGDFKIVGTPRFSKDNYTYILYQSPSTGAIYRQRFDFTTYYGGVYISPQVYGANWKVVGTPDLDGNGLSDILLQDSNTGNLRYLLMNGSQIANEGALNVALNNPAWQVVGTPDFDGDGIGDVLYENSSTGQIYYWLLQFTHDANNNPVVQVGNNGFLDSTGVPDYVVVGTPDLNGDGYADVILQSKSTGDVWGWVLRGTSFLLSHGMSSFGDTNWKVVATPKMFGDGKSSIVFRHATTGQVYYWRMNSWNTTGFNITWGVLSNASQPNLDVLAPR